MLSLNIGLEDHSLEISNSLVSLLLPVLCEWFPEGSTPRLLARLGDLSEGLLNLLSRLDSLVTTAGGSDAFVISLNLSQACADFESSNPHLGDNGKASRVLVICSQQPWQGRILEKDAAGFDRSVVRSVFICLMGQSRELGGPVSHDP